VTLLSRQSFEKNKFSGYFYNRITYAGVILALIFFVIECVLFGIDFFTDGKNVYLGILTYVILPPFIILGLIFIPVGAFWKRRRVLKGIAEIAPRKIFIDLTLPTHRNAVIVFIIGTAVLVVMTAVGSYKAYNYTESVHFCGITCHDLMKPEYTAYINSSHARVKCVDCHIGEGAGWYVRSKLSGVGQVYHTLKKDYPRPIPTPVRNLRPAKETCEQCHWPGKFYSSVEMRRTYYSSGQDGSRPWFLRVLLHAGGNDAAREGIHAHMYIDNEIYYAAEDEQRQKITWIKSVGGDGKPVVYTSPDSKFKDMDPPADQIRKMDCVDCHNRPTHNFKAPYELVNGAFLEGTISADVPDAKTKVMEALSGDYSSTEEAVEKIGQDLRRYYKEKYPDFDRDHKDKIDRMIDAAVAMYKNYFFPEMKTRWDVRPDNIGHLWSPGCFRCHDGEHASSDGKTITKDCSVCHTIIEQGPPDAMESNTQGVAFKHPFEDDGLWREMNCYDCHTGN